MLYIPNINDYLKILIAEEVKDFVVIHFSEYTRKAFDDFKNKQQNCMK